MIQQAMTRSQTILLCNVLYSQMFLTTLNDSNTIFGIDTIETSDE